jgi:hypothetical protein
MESQHQIIRALQHTYTKKTQIRAWWKGNKIIGSRDIRVSDIVLGYCRMDDYIVADRKGDL